MSPGLIRKVRHGAHEGERAVGESICEKLLGPGVCWRSPWSGNLWLDACHDWMLRIILFQVHLSDRSSWHLSWQCPRPPTFYSRVRLRGSKEPLIPILRNGQHHDKIMVFLEVLSWPKGYRIWLLWSPLGREPSGRFSSFFLSFFLED